MVSVRTELNSRANADGTHTVMIRYTAHRTPKREGTMVRIAKKDYNPKGSFVKENWVRASCPQYLLFNRTILDRMKVIYGVVQEMEKRGGVVDVEGIFQELARRDGDTAKENGEKEPCFLGFFQSEVDRMRENHPRHADNFQATYNKLEEFLAGRSLPFDKLTVRLVKDYYAWECQRNKISTVNKSISRMWGIFNEASKEGLVEKANPFGLLSRKKAGKVQRRRLEFSEMQRLADLELPPQRREAQIRDIFLFQFYVHGMRIGDAVALKVGEVRQGPAGLVLTYTTEKTEAGLVGIELVGQAEAILRPYLDGKRPDQFVFPFLKDELDYSDKYFLECQVESKTTYINRVIKKLAGRAGIENPEEVTTHVARHSFADLARRSGASVYDISKGLRHGSIRITEMYLSSLDEDAVNSLNGVYGKTTETVQKQADADTVQKQL
jgi:integrase/recombinase XerD